MRKDHTVLLMHPGDFKRVLSMQDGVVVELIPRGSSSQFGPRKLSQWRQPQSVDDQAKKVSCVGQHCCPQRMGKPGLNQGHHRAYM